MPVPPIHMQSRRTGSALRRSLILYCTCVPVKLGPVVPALGSAWRESPDPAVAVGEGLLGAPFILKYGGTAVVSACGLSRQQLVDAGLQTVASLRTLRTPFGVPSGPCHRPALGLTSGCRDVSLASRRLATAKAQKTCRDR